MINPGSATGAYSSITYDVNPSFVLMDIDGQVRKTGLSTRCPFYVCDLVHEFVVCLPRVPLAF